MAVLPDADRARIWRGLMRQAGQGVANVTKTDLRAAVDATDQWIDDNQTNFNNALPTAFKNNASLAQKTLLFCAVACMRVGLTTLQRLFGEVD